MRRSSQFRAAGLGDADEGVGHVGRRGGGSVHRIGFAGSGHLLRRENAGEFPAVGALHLPQVKCSLEIQPAARINLEEPPEARGGVGGDGTPAGEDFAQAALRDAGGLGGGQLGDAERLEKLLPEDEAGVGQGGWFVHGHVLNDSR